MSIEVARILVNECNFIMQRAQSGSRAGARLCLDLGVGHRLLAHARGGVDIVGVAGVRVDRHPYQMLGCSPDDSHNASCVSGTAAIGIAINTAQHHLKMISPLISGLHLAGIPSSAIHVFIGDSPRAPPQRPCVRLHHDPYENVDFNVFYALCDDRVLLHTHPAWLYLHGSSAIQSSARFRQFYTQLAPHTAKLCGKWNANYGVYASSDIAALCPLLSSIRNMRHNNSLDMKLVAYRYEDTLFKWLNVTRALLPAQYSGHCHVQTARTRRYGGTMRLEWVYPSAGLCKYKSSSNHLAGISRRTIGA